MSVAYSIERAAKEKGRIAYPASLLLLIAILTASILETRGQTSDETQTKLKAAFVLKFALYVEWPTNSFSSPTNPVVFGVLGRDPLARFLEQTVQDQTVDKRPIEVKLARNIADLLDCHVIFLGAAERDRLRTVLPRFQGKPVLTVSDADGFTSSGGMIGLKRKQGAMRFDINRHAAEACGLKISSRLLKLGDEVR